LVASTMCAPTREAGSGETRRVCADGAARDASRGVGTGGHSGGGGHGADVHRPRDGRASRRAARGGRRAAHHRVRRLQARGGWLRVGTTHRPSRHLPRRPASPASPPPRRRGVPRKRCVAARATQGGAGRSSGRHRTMAASTPTAALLPPRRTIATSRIPQMGGWRAIPRRCVRAAAPTTDTTDTTTDDGRPAGVAGTIGGLRALRDGAVDGSGGARAHAPGHARADGRRRSRRRPTARAAAPGHRAGQVHQAGRRLPLPGGCAWTLSSTLPAAPSASVARTPHSSAVSSHAPSPKERRSQSW